MSFMSVPALDRLFEPSEIDPTLVQSLTTRIDRRTANTMSPLFSSHPHSKPSPPQSSTSPHTLSPSLYALNFKQQGLDGSNGGIVETSCHDFDEAMQRTSRQVCEATSSFREDRDVVPNVRDKVTNRKDVLNEDGVLLVREVHDPLPLGGKSWKGHEKFQFKNIDKIEKLMTNTTTKKVELKSNGWWKQESAKGFRSRDLSIGPHDSDFSSSSSSNREEFFDAPEEPLEDSASDNERLQAQRNSRSKFDGSRDLNGNLKSLLDQEIKRRMAAEDAMAFLQLQCIDMASHLASVDGGSCGLIDLGRNSWDNGSQTQKLVVSQVVAYAVARGAARAEVDEEMENVIFDKNHEIARLRDKLHYYELVNHEMSQRNQEAFELARSRRHTRRNQNQWLMVCVGSAICVGVSAILVCKFAPWASSKFPTGAILKSHTQTNIYHSSPSCDI